jgi:cold shock protein
MAFLLLAARARAVSVVPRALTVPAAAYATGTVKWFNTTKGFGFIMGDDAGKDYFVHQSSVKMEGFRFLEEGERVQFDVMQGEKGVQAVNVTGLNGAPLSGEVANRAGQQQQQQGQGQGQGQRRGPRSAGGRKEGRDGGDRGGDRGSNVDA